MTSDIRLAFSHPEDRAEASAVDPRDRISLRDHVVEVDIGAFQLERGARQRVRFNLVVEVRPQPGPLDDDVDRILSYEVLVEAIDIELAAERLNLLETLAERVAERILTEPRAMRAFVRVEKLDVGPYALGVEIVRSRTEVPLKVAAGDGAGATLHPLVVFIGNDVIAGAGLAAHLDRWAAGDVPVVLCVGLPDGAAPQSAAIITSSQQTMANRSETSRRCFQDRRLEWDLAFRSTIIQKDKRSGAGAGGLGSERSKIDVLIEKPWQVGVNSP